MGCVLADLGKHIGNEELRAEIEELWAQVSELSPDDGDYAEKMEQIDSLQGAIDFCDWNDDPEYIREDWFFGGYAEFLASGLGPTEGWPYDYIDWAKAADALAQDYKTLDILGQCYYVRG